MLLFTLLPTHWSIRHTLMTTSVQLLIYISENGTNSTSIKYSTHADVHALHVYYKLWVALSYKVLKIAT